MMEKNIKFEEKILTLQGENEKLTAELAQQHQLEQDLQNEIKFLNEQIEMLREEQETLEILQERFLLLGEDLSLPTGSIVNKPVAGIQMVHGGRMVDGFCLTAPIHT